MPKIKTREFHSSCVVDLEGRVRNMFDVLQRGFSSCLQLPERTGSLALVGSGPSVRAHLEELRNWPDEIWAVNGAYRYLLEQGIVPHGFFGMDPLPGLAQYVEQTHPDTTFYIASICDPSVFDNLTDRKVMLWHPDGDDMPYPDGERKVFGGTTALTRAPFLGLLLGWRDMTLFGADSSFSEQQYCYEWGTYACDIDQPIMWFEANGEGPFPTELGLVKQASQLRMMHERMRGMLKFRCEGLLDAFMRAPMADESLFEMDTDEPSEADAA